MNSITCRAPGLSKHVSEVRVLILYFLYFLIFS